MKGRRCSLLASVFPLLCALCLAAEPVAAPSVRPNRDRISAGLRKTLRAVKREYWVTEFGRHLLSLTEHLPVRERGPHRGAMVRYVPGEPSVLVVDPRQAAGADTLDFEVGFILAREQALLRPPVPLVDAELAAQQAVLEYALQKAAARPEFSKALRAATRAGERLVRERKKRYDFIEDRENDGRLIFPGRRPEGALERLGFDLYLFSEDPYLFYAAVAESADLSVDAVTLTELEDFIERHGAHLDRGVFQALGRYALVERRVYPGRILRAARVVRDRDGLARIRERLGPFRGAGREKLLEGVNRWIRKGK